MVERLVERTPGGKAAPLAQGSDETYAASQLWKADWERFQDDDVTERAQNIIRQLDPMRQTEGQS